MYLMISVQQEQRVERLDDSGVGFEVGLIEMVEHV